MGPKQVLQLQVRVDLGVMAMKGYSTFPRSPKLEPHHQMQFSVISRILNKEYSQYIPSPANRAIGILGVVNTMFLFTHSSALIRYNKHPREKKENLFHGTKHNGTEKFGHKCTR